MASVANQIRAAAAALTSAADTVDELESGPAPSGPAPIPPAHDCLAGSWPTSVLPLPLPYPPNDVETAAMTTLLSYYDRKMAHCPSGTIMVIGDSLVQDMVAFKLGPHVECFGVGGETLRRCFNRLGRGGLIHRAGAVVLATGINEIANFTYNAPYTWAQIANNFAIMHQCLAAQATGNWLIRDILPVDEPVVCAIDSRWAGMNAKISDANQRVRASWANSAAKVEFSASGAHLIDASGNLADANHIGDGVHLSAAGHDIVAGIDAAALARLF